MGGEGRVFALQAFKRYAGEEVDPTGTVCAQRWARCSMSQGTGVAVLVGEKIDGDWEHGQPRRCRLYETVLSTYREMSHV